MMAQIGPLWEGGQSNADHCWRGGDGGGGQPKADHCWRGGVGGLRIPHFGWRNMWTAPYVLLRAKRGLSLEWKLVAQQIAFYLINFYGFVKFSNLLKFCSWKQTRLRFIFLESYLSYSCFEYSTSASCETYHVCKLVLPLKKQQQRNALGFCLTGFWWNVTGWFFATLLHKKLQIVKAFDSKEDFSLLVDSLIKLSLDNCSVKKLPQILSIIFFYVFS